jgi:hypothetical protein
MATDVESAIRQILQRGVEATEAQVVQKSDALSGVATKDPSTWTDEEWEFANQRGRIPPELQSEYELRLLEKRHALERAALGQWQGGNNPETGTATVGVASGQIPAVPERPVSATLVQEVPSSETEPAPPYEQWSKTELQEEVDARNEGRPDDQKLNRAGTKEELSQRLYDDDEQATPES